MRTSFKFYEKGGPVFLVVDGEGLGIDWLTNEIDAGNMMISEWAKEHNAALFIVEHRFYGRSNTCNWKEDNIECFQWLSSRYY